MDIKKIYNIYIDCKQEVCTDTRNIVAGSLFIALHGENFNGNHFIKKALELGCQYALSDDASYATSKNVIVVEDTLAALQELANHHRRQFDIPVLGITGSNGKTTTKELLNNVLLEKYNVLCTKGNLNNHLGVPFTLLKLRKEHDFAIIEMGANHLGDIQELCEIAEPNFGIITNIGKAHMQGFGSIEGIIKTKSELYNYLEKIEGVIFINSNEEYLRNIEKNYTSKIIFGESSSLGFEVLDSVDYLKVKIDSIEIQSQLFGDYNGNNILSAYAIGRYFKIEPEIIKKAIESYIPSNNRSQIKCTKRNNKLVLDAYNANPTSMNLAIDQFIRNKNKKLLILGEMKELGDISTEEHLQILDKLSEYKDSVVYVGMEFKKYEKRYQQQFFANVKKLTDSNILNSIENCDVLIKGSRSVKLDLIEDLL